LNKFTADVALRLPFTGHETAAFCPEFPESVLFIWRLSGFSGHAKKDTVKREKPSGAF
jgi:hypothetical protein